jgi:hypothetical protein
MFVIAVKFGKTVRYNHEIILIKHAKPNQLCYSVRYNRVFVITVIVITEFDCILKDWLKVSIVRFKKKK